MNWNILLVLFSHHNPLTYLTDAMKLVYVSANDHPLADGCGLRDYRANHFAASPPLRRDLIAERKLAHATHVQRSFLIGSPVMNEVGLDDTHRGSYC